MARDPIFNIADRVPYLSKDQEAQLIADWKNNGNVDAMHTLVMAHLRLVRRFVYSIKTSDDVRRFLFSEGIVALLIAAKKFEQSKGVRFSTYASWWLKAHVYEELHNLNSNVRLYISKSDKAAIHRSLRKHRKSLAEQDRDTLDVNFVDNIADDLEISRNLVQKYFYFLAGDVTLSEPTGIAISLEDKSCTPETMEYSVERSSLAAAVKRALEVLNEREASIIRQRRLSHDPLTLEELGTQMGVSKERIRQIEQRAFEKMRPLLEPFREVTA
ncbi:sigma-70 family RNA polymerase sigma factor [Roseibium sp. Sym1]|uniref:sigma-70 family RNA polymerase sigma factor n=1 Tax=Roseibium sp. Sym1 TaxID=3016006 RepID=UPI0022B44F50|nr:sigma-70 family RNA polymerase sigma factor [Roseibium sp. Sym1]